MHMIKTFNTIEPETLVRSPTALAQPSTVAMQCEP